MKERPILFNAEMVKAILSGRKTQTRRVVKFPLIDKDIGCELAGNELAGEVAAGDYRNCPLWPGDKLWVRETFATLACGSYEPEKPSLTGTYQEVRYFATDRLAGCDAGVRGYNWRPSIHMPRWASRIDLLITGVRVERLQDISNADIRAEGAAQFGCTHHRLKFQSLWESIYGDDSWQANPWVWVIEFKLIAPAREQP